MNKYTQYFVDDYDPLSVIDNSDEDWYDGNDDELATLVIAEMFDDTRWDYCRVSWTDHVDKLIHEKMFDRTYRMSYESFCKLADMLRVKLSCDCVKSKASCSGTSGLQIFPELVMAIGLRWLAEEVILTSRMLIGAVQHLYTDAETLFCMQLMPVRN